MIRTSSASVIVEFFSAYFFPIVVCGISMDGLKSWFLLTGVGNVIVEFCPLNKPAPEVWQSPRWRITKGVRSNRLSISVKALFCLGILQGGLSVPSQAAEVDALMWTRAFTNLCLQEAYSKPNAVEALYFVGQTANSVCGCGGELMGATLTVEELAFYSVNKKMRGDTKMRWRKGLVQCMNRNIAPPATDVATLER
jgi:hypothetical protein